MPPFFYPHKCLRIWEQRCTFAHHDKIDSYRGYGELRRWGAALLLVYTFQGLVRTGIPLRHIGGKPHRVLRLRHALRTLSTRRCYIQPLVPAADHRTLRGIHHLLDILAREHDHAAERQLHGIGHIHSRKRNTRHSTRGSRSGCG